MESMFLIEVHSTSVCTRNEECYIMFVQINL